VSNNTDTTDRVADPTYIDEPSTEPSEESVSQMKVSNTNPQKFREKKYQARRPDSMGLVSPPKSGF
jgi:hypothetical protein